MKQFICEYFYVGDEDFFHRSRCVADTVVEVEQLLSAEAELAQFKVCSVDDWAHEEAAPRVIETQNSFEGGTMFFTEEPEDVELSHEVAGRMLNGIRSELTDKPQPFHELIDKVVPGVFALTEDYDAFVWAISWLEVKKELVRTKEGYRKTSTTKAANDHPRRSSKGNSLGVLQDDGGHGSTHDAF